MLSVRAACGKYKFAYVSNLEPELFPTDRYTAYCKSSKRNQHNLLTLLVVRLPKQCKLQFAYPLHTGRRIAYIDMVPKISSFSLETTLSILKSFHTVIDDFLRDYWGMSAKFHPHTFSVQLTIADSKCGSDRNSAPDDFTVRYFQCGDVIASCKSCW